LKAVKQLFIFLSLIAMVWLASCTKSSSNSSSTDPAANFMLIPDTGVYYVKSGTVSVTTPDTTFTYDASKDFVIIYNKATNYLIGCSNIKNQALILQSLNKPIISAPDSLLYAQVIGGPNNAAYYYINSSFTNVGAINLTAYNTNGEAAAGTFTLNLSQAAAGTFTFLNTNVYTVTGSFDLKLSPK